MARLGTVSAASEELGVHRATVTRHVNLLEEVYGAKLFLRSQTGFTPTEFGAEMLRIADLAEAGFQELHRIARRDQTKLAGELVISTLELLLPEVLPAVATFSSAFPDVTIKLVTTDTIARLEYGEADIAFRVGAPPQEPDSVVVPFKSVEFGLFASPAYLEKLGMSDGAFDLSQMSFIVPANPAIQKKSFLRWLAQTVPKQAVKVEFGDAERIVSAIEYGVGAGFVPLNRHPSVDHLVEIHPRPNFWKVDSWQVTHVDLHRNEKIQAFLSILRDEQVLPMMGR